MKKLLTLFGTLFLLGGLVAPLHAQGVEDEAAETEVAAEETEEISIPDLLQKVEFVTKVKPKKKAYVYFFLRSHSRCGFCRTITPRMNELYKEMKIRVQNLLCLTATPIPKKQRNGQMKPISPFP